MRVYKLFIKSKYDEKFQFFMEFNENQIASFLDLVNCLYIGSKILLEVKSV